MTEFGPIMAIYTTNPCTAYVVFVNLDDSCDVITARTLGIPGNPLYCHWLHKSMVNKLFYPRKKGVGVHHDEFIKPTK